MFIEIRELELHPVDFQETFQPDAIDLGADVRQRTALTTSGRAQLVEEHDGKHQVIKDIRLTGDLATSLELPCARCLDPVPGHIDRQFDLLYRPLGVDRRGEEAAIHEPDTEIGYYEGEGLQLEDALREQVLLAVPIKAVCQDACKGLCPLCGRNLNRETCDCSAPQLDQRWAALKDLKDKLK